MKWEWTITFGNVLTIMTIIISILTYMHSRASDRKLRRATFVRDYTLHFYQSPEVSESFFDIDYERFKFDQAILGTEKELRLVRLLDLLNSLGFNCENEVIFMSDIDKTTLGYAVARVYSNPEVKKYLNHVDAHSTNIGMGEVAFGHFRALGHQLTYSIMSTPTQSQVKGATAP